MRGWEHERERGRREQERDIERERGGEEKGSEKQSIVLYRMGIRIFIICKEIQPDKSETKGSCGHWNKREQIGEVT